MITFILVLLFSARVLSWFSIAIRHFPKESVGNHSWFACALSLLQLEILPTPSEPADKHYRVKKRGLLRPSLKKATERLVLVNHVQTWFLFLQLHSPLFSLGLPVWGVITCSTVALTILKYFVLSEKSSTYYKQSGLKDWTEADCSGSVNNRFWSSFAFTLLSRGLHRGVKHGSAYWMLSNVQERQEHTWHNLCLGSFLLRSGRLLAIVYACFCPNTSKFIFSFWKMVGYELLVDLFLITSYSSSSF